MNYEAHQLEEIYRLATVYIAALYVCIFVAILIFDPWEERELAVWLYNILRSIYKCVCMCAAHLFYFLYFFSLVLFERKWHDLLLQRGAE